MLYKNRKPKSHKKQQQTKNIFINIHRQRHSTTQTKRHKEHKTQHSERLKAWVNKYVFNNNLKLEIVWADLMLTGNKFHSFGPATENVSGYVCNHGSPSGERDTASPRGRYGERPQRDSVWRYICKNTTCWPATAHDVTTGVPQYKCRREDTSSASSSEACVRSMAQSPGDAVSRSPLGEPWLHT